MGITRITQEEARTSRGVTDMKRLAQRTEEEIHQAALDDPDNPPMTEEQLKEFRPVYPRGKPDKPGA